MQKEKNSDTQINLVSQKKRLAVLLILVFLLAAVFQWEGRWLGMGQIRMSGIVLMIFMLFLSLRCRRRLAFLLYSGAVLCYFLYCFLPVPWIQKSSVNDSLAAAFFLCLASLISARFQVSRQK